MTNPASRISADEMTGELARVLRSLGFAEDRAKICARMFADASLDGVYSHGLNRFPRFIRMIELGEIDIDASPVRVSDEGVIEQWDGQLGPGNLNARDGMARALELATEYGMGCVAMRNTNHWMRGGAYGWQAAEAGFVGMCWTNTNQNMPPWGSSGPTIGNNPLIIGVPRSAGPVVLDIAMAQFSYGALSSYKKRGQSLPVPGGYDTEGALTDDPGAIGDAGRPLPIGYWKGSGLSIVLDLVAAMMSGGKSTKDIESDPLKESGLSQIFLAMDPGRFSSPESLDSLVDGVTDHINRSPKAKGVREVRYPGQNTMRIRDENTRLGIPVDPEVWSNIKKRAL